ncbi:MAG: hypothetical protein ACFFC7_20365 [Candidatus Hermodarchaeota archaeon]
MGVILFSDKILNFLLSWHLFHMFAFSGVFVLLIFEFNWWLEKRTNLRVYLDHRQFIILSFLIGLILILVIFLLFHDFSPTEVPLFPELNLIDIFKFAFLDNGQYPVIPWLSFSITGGLVASYLDLTRAERKVFGKRVTKVILLALIPLVVGLLFLNLEGFDHAHMFSRATSSYVFIDLGVLCIGTVILIWFLDIDSIYASRKINKVLYLFVLISQITFTVYIVHNVLFSLDSSFITSEIGLYLISILYWFLFVLIAYIWKKWDFIFSFEWMIAKFQDLEWRRNHRKS